MRKLWSRPGFRDGVMLGCFYLLIHGFMLILTGTFHDDWTSWFKDPVTKSLEGWESGRPYYSLVIEAVWGLPGYGYRILAFVTYFISYLFMYKTLSCVPELRRRDAVWMAVAAMAMPVNDARVLLANYPYALGMMLFWIACWMLVKHIGELKKIPFRMGTLALFFLSFTLNSNLVMYGGVLLYMLIRIRPREWVKYLDYAILPVAFFLLTRKLFPLQGAFAAESYNEVTLNGLLWAVGAIPQTIRNLLLALAETLTDDHIGLIAAMAAAVICGLFLWWRERGKRADAADREKTGEKANLILFLFGLVFFTAGFFSYTVVRGTATLNLLGITGRDSMQLGFGAALMLYSFPVRKLRRPMVIFTAVLAMFHFGNWYLYYQAEWYRELAFQKQIVRIEEIAGGGNYVVNCSQSSAVEDRRFYTWSGNAAAATGRQNLFLFNGPDNAAMLESPERMKTILKEYPMFGDYTYHPEVDGNLNYEIHISPEDAKRLKLLELFQPNDFEEEMEKLGTIQYVKAE